MRARGPRPQGAKLTPLSMAAVRAHFILRGTTLAQFARGHGYNLMTTTRAILAVQHGPKHRAIRRLIDEEMTWPGEETNE